jgi:hypothetical protein
MAEAYLAGQQTINNTTNIDQSTKNTYPTYNNSYTTTVTGSGIYCGPGETVTVSSNTKWVYYLMYSASSTKGSISSSGIIAHGYSPDTTGIVKFTSSSSYAVTNTSSGSGAAIFAVV